ncbi:MAG: hypothetical protein KA715_09935 [Xanthomonadaceae bacterium]|nr:hypothetical protein [Xanthomonadaceae bacterium]
MNNNSSNNKPKIVASIIVVLIAIASISFYMKNRNGSSPAQGEQSSGEKTLDVTDQSKFTPSGTRHSGDVAPGAPVANAPIAEEPPCKIVKMKPVDGKGTYRKNLLILSESQLNTKSVCVKVDGTPVKFSLFQKKANQILIAGVSGAKAEIQVRYCRDKNLCKDDCKIPRDEFMDALGASDDSGDSNARWEDGKESDTEKNVAKQMNMFKEDLKAIEAKAIASMSKWDAKDSQAACTGTGSVDQK